MNLYYVQLQGLRTSSYGGAYVVAEGLDEAANKVISYLEENDIGYRADRVLESISIIATTDAIHHTSKCPRLYL